ncbi:MAG: sigma-E processing peptidase SpoIIGA [Clostridia bacterium]|nr:sigma-E processing peptidase SpoIIGA [Clostridia bacterium]
MTIYLDVVLIENLCMNYIILFTTGYVLKVKRKHIRIIISALLGGIYSILAYMEIMEIYSNIIIKIIISIVMVYIAFVPKNIKEMLKILVFFYLASFAFGGCAFALLYFIKPEEILMRNGVLIGTYPLKIALLGGILGFIILSISFYIIKNKIIKKNIFCNLTIYMEGKSKNITALIDTGNMLKEPITNFPVIVVEKNSLDELIQNEILSNIDNIIEGNLPEELYKSKCLNKFRVIPFKSLGKENGLLLGFKVDKISIQIEESEKIVEDVIVGIYKFKLSKKDQYSALIGLDLIEGGNENEFIKSFSRKY